MGSTLTAVRSEEIHTQQVVVESTRRAGSGSRLVTPLVLRSLTQRQDDAAGN